jgi:hypothetical protein
MESLTASPCETIEKLMNFGGAICRSRGGPCLGVEECGWLYAPPKTRQGFFATFVHFFRELGFLHQDICSVIRVFTSGGEFPGTPFMARGIL